MKVFVSHQSADSDQAKRIAARLRELHAIDCYLDVIDPYIGRRGEDLADHIRAEMGKCTQLLAVVSQATQASQWVPWEIGVATEKNFPLATYLGNSAHVPEFLEKWPYLRTEQDVDRYARASDTATASLMRKRATLNETAARAGSTQDFFRTLRASLGQN